MSNLTSIHGGNQTLIDDSELCTLATCDLTLANLTYLPSLPGNAFFAACFSIFLIAQIYLGIRYKTWGFMAAMALGLTGELIGYVGRIMMHNNPFSQDNFLTYLVCLTLSPALLSAAVYLCLARIVVVYGEHASRFKPRTYTILFCSCDFLSLLLQAIGGAIASVSNDSKTTDMGINIMLAGVSAQVASLFLFIFFCGEFALRLYQNPTTWSSTYAGLYHSRLFKAFLIGLCTATLTITIRSIFRVAELSSGFDGKLANNEISFMILEGAMIVIACGSLTALHPGLAFQGVWSDVNFSFRTSKSSAREGDEEKFDVGEVVVAVPVSVGRRVRSGDVNQVYGHTRGPSGSSERYIPSPAPSAEDDRFPARYVTPLGSDLRTL